MNENEFENNWENNDFFKKHLDNLDMEKYTDENGDFDFDKLKRESSKLFEEMTGKPIEEFFDSEILNLNESIQSLSDDKVGIGFVQDLDSEEGVNMFDALIELHDLHKVSDIIDINHVKFVEETWTNDNNTIKLKRVYELTDETTSLLSIDEQINLYNNKLESVLEVEDYEEAVVLRDIINNLKLKLNDN